MFRKFHIVFLLFVLSSFADHNGCFSAWCLWLIKREKQRAVFLMLQPPMQL